MAQLLIAHRADLNARAQLGRTPLMEAARQGAVFWGSLGIFGIARHVSIIYVIIYV